MPIRVDLPAPFSPTMPWIEPALTTSEMFRFAWTSPNHLSIPRSSIAAAPLSSSHSDMVRSSELFSHVVGGADHIDRKSTRLNSSHVRTSYAVFCLRKNDWDSTSNGRPAELPSARSLHTKRGTPQCS